MNREEFINRVYRDFGAPYVKVELSVEHISDSIDEMMELYKQWAIGNIVRETYVAIKLEFGKNLYSLPDGVQTVVSYNEANKFGSINTLFTMDNYLYNQGMLNPWNWGNGDGFLTYHLALDFLETLDKYTVDKYTWEYFPHTNQVKISPTPSEKLQNTNLTGFYQDGCGTILLKTYALMGTNTESNSPSAADFEIFDKPWAKKYVKALCKVKLGMIRRKFDSFQSIGNTGISLDGSDLINEGKEEISVLEEQLKIEEVYEGYGITMG